MFNFNVDVVALAQRNVFTRMIVPVAVRAVGTTKRYSPELALVGGIAAGAMAAYKFAQAYKEASDVFEARKADIEKARELMNDIPEDQPMVKRVATVNLARAYGSYAGQVVKTYGPSMAYAAVSVYLLVSGHRIMRGRNAVVLAAAKALETAFARYRENVIAEHGKEADDRYLHGIRREVLTEQVVDEDGKTKKKVTTSPKIGADPQLLYSRPFDRSNPNWEHSREINKFKLLTNQSWFNDMLRIRKVVLLNEVYDSFAMPRSAEGAVVGWALDAPGDNFITFGLDEEINQGPENEFLLTFNVNGVVFEYI
jgi:hypothetical protein